MKTALVKLRFDGHLLATVALPYENYLPSAIDRYLEMVMDEPTRQSAAQNVSGMWEGNRTTDRVEWLKLGDIA